MKIIRINTDQHFIDALQKLSVSALIGLDTETTALFPSPDNPAGKIRLMQFAHDVAYPDGATERFCYVVDTFSFTPSGVALSALADLLESKTTIKIAHNAKFDLRWLMWEFERRWQLRRIYPEGIYCTHLASVMLEGGRNTGIKGHHSLVGVCARKLGIVVEKELQLSDWSAPLLTDEQIIYAAADSDYVLKLHPVLSAALVENDLLRTACIEFGCISAIADMENNGMPLNRQMWADLLVRKTGERDEALALLMNQLQRACNWFIKNPAKVGSRPPRLKRDYGRKPVKPKLHGAKALKGGLIARREKDVDVAFLIEENARMAREYEAAMLAYEAQQSSFNQRVGEWQTEFDAWSALPQEVPAAINLNSSAQVARALRNQGVPIEATNEKALEKLSVKLTGVGDRLVDRIYPEAPSRILFPAGEEGSEIYEAAQSAHAIECAEIEKLPRYTGKQAAAALAILLDYRGTEKSVGSFGQTYIDAIQSDGVLRTEFRQIGAEQTGRMSSGGSSGINLQQIPHDTRHRFCFKAPHGHMIVDADYSAIEPRIAAQFSRDESLIQIFKDGRDAYKLGASKMYDVPYEEITKTLRNGFKVILLGLNYGMGTESLSAKLACSFPEAAKQKRLFFQAMPKLESYLNAAGAQMKQHGWTRSSSGRLLHFNGDLSDPEQAASADRLGRNAPIQGTSADIMKLALGMMFLRLKGTSGRLRSVIHDEVVATALIEDAAEVGKIIEACMIEAAKVFLPDVPVVADPLLSDCWIKELNAKCCVCTSDVDLADEASWLYVTQADVRHQTCKITITK